MLASASTEKAVADTAVNSRIVFMVILPEMIPAAFF
jgi:hypothetical protein